MTNTFSTMGAIFKQVFAEKVLEIVPDHNYLIKNIGFQKAKKLGASYEQPVALTREWGYTFNSDGSAFALNSARQAVYNRATLSGCELLMRGQISYAALERSIGDKAAFAEASALVVKNLTESMSNIVEHELIYGQSPIATFDATGSGTITITAATWAEGFWVNAIGMPFDVFATTGSASPTNAVGAVVVSAINTSTRVVTFTGAAQDLTDIDALSAGVVYFRGVKTGASSYVDCVGLDTMTSATTLFGISTSTYNLWKPRSYAVGSADLTLAKVQRGLASAVNAGLSEDIVLLCNPLTWANLNNELGALRSIDYSFNSENAKNGAKSITYFSQNGKIEVVSHPYVKQGEAFAFPKNRCMRIGSRDIGFGAPGQTMKDDILFHLESTAAVEFRMYTDQALFLTRPGTLVKFTGIVNT